MTPLRLKRFGERLRGAGVDGLLVSSAPNVTYLSGFTGHDSWLLAGDRKRYLITDSRYVEQAEREAKGFEVVLRDRRPITELVADLARRSRFRRVGFESGIVTHAFFTALTGRSRGLVFKPTLGLVEALREIKDAEEIARLRRSASIAVQGFHFARRTARAGMTERELQGRVELHTKTLGSEKPAFDLIIASGARSSMPHCKTDQHRIRRPGMVLVDMGVVYRGYHSDLTRPVFLGKMSALQKKIFQIVWEAQRLGIQKVRPGVTCREVDAVCRDAIRKAGYERYFGHGTGHGVGLEIHEAPTVSGRSQTVLQPGMVVTVEPGIYLPGRFGIRIEDMVLVTQKGNEVLTRDLD